jgi:hypothetical protein
MYNSVLIPKWPINYLQNPAKLCDPASGPESSGIHSARNIRRVDSTCDAGPQCSSLILDNFSTHKTTMITEQLDKLNDTAKAFWRTRNLVPLRLKKSWMMYSAMIALGLRP